jgi:hypothetical protein
MSRPITKFMDICVGLTETAGIVASLEVQSDAEYISRHILSSLRNNQHKKFKPMGSFCVGRAIQVSKHSLLLSRREKTWDGHFG